MSEFTYPHEPKEGHQWWRRPSYFSMMCCPMEFEWTCAFCGHQELDDKNYGKVGYQCPECGAIFIGDDSFGTWMAKEMPVEWCKDRHEAWA